MELRAVFVNYRVYRSHAPRLSDKEHRNELNWQLSEKWKSWLFTMGMLLRGAGCRI
jgi:hypothetical protein